MAGALVAFPASAASDRFGRRAVIAGGLALALVALVGLIATAALPLIIVFAALWSAQAVYGKSQDPTELVHPDVGPLALVSQSFDVRGAAGQLLVVYQPEPGGADAQALTLLGALGATRRA